MKTLFRNFSYKFGGKHYLQLDGGPIGVRMTGSASEIVMLAWSRAYRRILEDSELWVPLLKGYVDDGRQGSTVLPEGSRFCKESRRFKQSKEALAEDVARRMAGESVTHLGV